MDSLISRAGAALLSTLCTAPMWGQDAAPAKPPESAAQTTPAVRLGGYLQGRETYRDGVGLTGSINRARLTASGGAKSLTSNSGEGRSGCWPTT